MAPGNQLAFGAFVLDTVAKCLMRAKVQRRCSALVIFTAVPPDFPLQEKLSKGPLTEEVGRTDTLAFVLEWVDGATTRWWRRSNQSVLEPNNWRHHLRVGSQSRPTYSSSSDQSTEAALSTRSWDSPTHVPERTGSRWRREWDSNPR